MNMGQLKQATAEMKEQYKDVLGWFEQQGKRSWLIIKACSSHANAEATKEK